MEYGLTDIQEYYANTGALKRAAETAKGVCSGWIAWLGVQGVHAAARYGVRSEEALCGMTATAALPGQNRIVAFAGWGFAMAG